MGLGVEVADPVDGAVVLGGAVVPIDSDPVAGVTFHWPHVLHRPDPPRVTGQVDSLADSELGFHWV